MAAVLILLLGSPAHAAKQRVGDRRGDAPAKIDTRVMDVWRRSHGDVVVAFGSPTYDAGRRWNGIQVRYDTRGGGRADYELRWSFGRDGDGYRFFGLVHRGSRVACAGLDSYSRRRDRWIFTYVHVPRRCLSITKSVGVQGVTWDYTRYTSSGTPARGYADRTPDRGFAR